MSTKSGFLNSVASITALKALDTTPFVTNVAVVVANSSASGDQLGGVFYWDSASTASNDDINVIVPASVPVAGRWLRVEAGSVPMWVAAGGSANAITATYPVSNITLYDGLILAFRASTANTTTTPTFAPNGLTARTITQVGGAALVAGSIKGANAECLVRYRLASTTWELLNPAFAQMGANTDITSVYLNNTGLKIKDTNASHGLTIAPGSDITADRTFTLTTGDAARTLDLSGGNLTLAAGSFSTSVGNLSVTTATNSGINLSGGNLSLTGGNFSLTSGPLTITSGASRTMDISGGNVTFSGGTVSVTGGNFSVTSSGSRTLSVSAGNITVSGGDVTLPAGTALVAANNLSDVAAYATARTNLYVSPTPPQGRLTLTSVTPYLSTTVTGATTIYYTPAVGAFVPIYDGSNYKMTVFSEVSQALSDNTKSPAAAAASKNYDMFVWSDGGTIRCTRGPAWTSATVRGTGAGTTELQLIGGVYTNKVAITNGPGAGLGTYVGSISTDGSTQTNMNFGGVGAAGGETCRLDVWNAYNKANISTVNFDNTNSWSYITATWREKNNSAANSITFLAGLTGFSFTARNDIFNQNGDSSSIGLDSTTAFHAAASSGGVAGGAIYNLTSTTLMTAAPLGSHYVAPLEYGTGGSVWYGDNGGSVYQSLFFFSFMM